MLKDQTINSIEQAILQSYRRGVIIMIEPPTDAYFEVNSSTIKLLTSKGFQGELGYNFFCRWIVSRIKCYFRQ